MNLDRISFFADGLVRPECVLAHRSGLLFCSDAFGPGGVAIVRPDGSVARISAQNPPETLRPNGIAMMPGGSFLLAHLGEQFGGIYRLHADGVLEPFLTEMDGVRLPPSNFVVRDRSDRIWISMSTRLVPRDRAYRSNADDGYVILVDRNGARIVADGLGYTNECHIDDEHGYFYINETFGRRISRFRIGADGSLNDRTIIAQFGAGVFPDGLTADEDGHLWITSVVSNRIIRIDPQGRQEVLIEDSDAAYLDKVEQIFQAGRMAVSDIANLPSKKLVNISSIAFGGPDRKTGYIGSLGGARLAVMAMPVAGHQPAHWDVPLGALADYETATA